MTFPATSKPLTHDMPSIWKDTALWFGFAKTQLQAVHHASTHHSASGGSPSAPTGASSSPISFAKVSYTVPTEMGLKYIEMESKWTWNVANLKSLEHL